MASRRSFIRKSAQVAAAGNAIWDAQKLTEDKPIFVQFWDGTIAKIVPVVRGTKEMVLHT